MSKKIAFLGHSTVSWAGYDIFGTRSFIDLILEHFRYYLCAIGVREGSEERILQTLKKLPEIDIAVIFHSEPACLYLPGCFRDVNIKHFNDAKSEYLWKKDILQVQSESEYFADLGGVRETFVEVEVFLNTILSYKKFLYSPELAQSRFYGAALQIDQFCLSKNIKCLHVMLHDNFPSWLEIKSGKVCSEITQLMHYYMDKGYPNGLTAEGQTYFYKALAQEIEQL